MRSKRGTTWAGVCAFATKLPGVELGASYGTPALKVRKKLLARLKEDGETIVVRVGFDDRDALLAMDPRAFFVTDHYRAHPAVFVRLGAARPEVLHELLEREHGRLVAPRARRRR